jgi:hypothetical protein
MLQLVISHRASKQGNNITPGANKQLNSQDFPAENQTDLALKRNHTPPQ